MSRRSLNIFACLFFILPLYLSAQDTLPLNTGGSGVGRNPFVNGVKVEGRDMLKKPEVASEAICKEQGVVVMAITVDRAGNVTEAVAGRGSTNLAPCLVEQAKSAALKTKFNPNPNAPEKQKGFIKYDFRLKG